MVCVCLCAVDSMNTKFDIIRVYLGVISCRGHSSVCMQ